MRAPLVVNLRYLTGSIGIFDEIDLVHVVRYSGLASSEAQDNTHTNAGHPPWGVVPVHFVINHSMDACLDIRAVRSAHQGDTDGRKNQLQRSLIQRAVLIVTRPTTDSVTHFSSAA
jgi:hypothetical protein